MQSPDSNPCVSHGAIAFMSCWHFRLIEHRTFECRMLYFSDQEHTWSQPLGHANIDPWALGLLLLRLVTTAVILEA